MKKRFEIETIEISGFNAFVYSLRIPFKLDVRSKCFNKFSWEKEGNWEKEGKKASFKSNTNIDFDMRDLMLASKLKRAGDEHAKSIRLVTVDCLINAPLWWWQEMVTYEVGVTKGCSESTMHCECKGMKGEALEEYKDNIPSGLMQKRVYKISYQTLARIYYQRETHRLPVWKNMIKYIEELPFFEELIKRNIKK